jgi:radical SAM superfamily enzyme YgiQ (UPF0313 family)
MSQQYQWSLEKAEAIHAKWKNIPLVVGGVHVTMVPEEVCEDRVWNYVMAGEADHTFADLVDCLARGGDPVAEKLNAVRAHRDGKLIAHPVGPFPDLETFPPKDYDLFDMDLILKVKNGWQSILTSRGCPYKCTYCFNQEIIDLYQAEGGIKKRTEYLRHYPIPRIIEEIRDLKAKHDLRTIIFDDDLFTLNRKYVKEFCDAYIASGINLPFVVNAHVSQFDAEMAGWLKDAGCIIVKYGLESGSPRVRKEILHRHMTNQKIIDGFAAADVHNLHSSAFIMIGLPLETREEIEETLQICSEVKMGRFRWAVFFPFPGTASYTIAKQHNLIDYDKMARFAA